MKIRLLFTILLAWIFVSAFGQPVTVTGTITDAKDGSPMPGVNVIIENSTQGTVTDIDGKYSLKLPDKSVILVFSFLSYLTQKIAVGDQTVINVILKEDITKLDEVVVIGYGTVKKSDATGSVSVVSAKDFNKGAITSPQDLLVGKASGVNITSGGGAPGAGSTIRIRGGSSLSASNDPLIVIDGVPIDNSIIGGNNNNLNSINPNDIESFTVLKDASATAIFGSRASNGVILITTKKGGKSFKVVYNSTVSLNTLPKKLSVLSGDEFRNLIHTQFPTPDDTVKSNLLGKANTDWQSEIFRNAIVQDHNLSVSGTSAKIPYRLSLGYTSQQGILKNTDMNRSTLAVNINPSLLDNHLTIYLNAKGMYTNNNFGNTDAIGSAMGFDPTQPVRSTDTLYKKWGGYFAWLDYGGNPITIAPSNPVALCDLADNKSVVKRIMGNVQLDYKLHFLPDLKATLNLGYDRTKSKGHNNLPATASWTYPNLGQVGNYGGELRNDLLDFYLNYVKALDAIESKVDVTAGYSWQHFWYENDSKNLDLALKHVKDSTLDIKENFLISFFGRINYSLMDKYLLTFTLRDDGTSRFSPDNRWGLFPSGAFSWKISNEQFMKGLYVISDLKLRLGYGITGQQDIGSNYYPYIAFYSKSGNAAMYQFGNTFYYTLRPNAYDAHIKWEETTTSNIGLDFGLFKNRITGTIDYYFRKTNDLINQIPIPAGSNFSNEVLTNVGNLENKGIEIGVDAKIISSQDFLWQFGCTFGSNRNKITKLTRFSDTTSFGVNTGNLSGSVGNKIQNNNVGYPANSFFVFKQVYNTKGMPVENAYVDLSGQGGAVATSDANKYHYKSPAPDFLMGISSRVEYKNFDFSFSGRLSVGNYVYNNVASYEGTYVNLYTSAGFLGSVISASNKSKFATSQYWSDFYVENASFFRMDNISVGYRFNKIIGDKINLRLSAVVQNVFVITKYSGLDPEVNSIDVNGIATQGIDNNIYPRPRTFLIGLTAEF